MNVYTSIYMLLLKIADLFDQDRIPYAIVGGFGVALHGVVRATVDIDLVLNRKERDYKKAEMALNRIGLESRLPLKAEEVFRFREEYIRNRNLIAWSFHNPDRPSQLVDLVLTHDLKEFRVERVKVRNRSIRVASKEDLIRMKTGTGRRQDREDVRVLKELK